MVVVDRRPAADPSARNEISRIPIPAAHDPHKAPSPSSHASSESRPPPFPRPPARLRTVSTAFPRPRPALRTSRGPACPVYRTPARWPVLHESARSHLRRFRSPPPGAPLAPPRTPRRPMAPALVVTGTATRSGSGTKTVTAAATVGRFTGRPAPAPPRCPPDLQGPRVARGGDLGGRPAGRTMRSEACTAPDRPRTGPRGAARQDPRAGPRDHRHASVYPPADARRCLQRSGLRGRGQRRAPVPAPKRRLRRLGASSAGGYGDGDRDAHRHRHRDRDGRAWACR